MDAVVDGRPDPEAVRRIEEQALAYARDLRRLYGEERARRLEMEQAHRQLQDECRRRAEFVSLLAHELRAPIAVLANSLRLLHDGGLGELNDDSRVAVGVLHQRALQLSRLAAELAGCAATATEAARVRGVLGELPGRLHRRLEPVRWRADDRAVDLRFRASLQDVDVEVDLGLLSMAITQLADNAVKFGRPGGWASVSIEQEGSQLRVVVADNGPGLSDGVRYRLLQVGNGVAEPPVAADGLGLTIVAHAVRSLNASISVSAPQAKGTVVELSVPIEAA